MDEARSKIIEDHPIGEGLASFRSACESKGVSPATLDDIDRQVLQRLSYNLIWALGDLEASQLLPASRGENLMRDLIRLGPSIYSTDFDVNRTKPLLRAALAETVNDALIWNSAYRAVIELTPDPQPIASSVTQTPYTLHTGACSNTSENRQYLDKVLKQELGIIHVGVQGFREKFFGGVAGLEAASAAVLQKCTEGGLLLNNDGWVGWPEDANEDGVLCWLVETINKLTAFATGYISTPPARRQPVAQPNISILGSVGKRKMDIGFFDGLISNSNTRKGSRYHWRQVIVPGELKSNPTADTPSQAGLDLARYAREVFAAQDNRRYVLGFTLCGSFMRLWEFDRLGAIASEKFDIHEDALQFVYTILGFIWASDTELGFDPTILTVDGQRFIQIERNNQTEHLILDRVIRCSSCIAGRATICWKAHRKGSPQSPLVVKDSWQYTERSEEGELLHETTAKGVVNVARHYHHETVRVFNAVDDIQGNVRKGLAITTTEDHQHGGSDMLSTPQQGHSIAGTKRLSSQTDAIMPPKKRQAHSVPLTKAPGNVQNRIRRRIIMSDYGKPIYKAGSHATLLRAFKDCIQGHQSLRSEAGLLHRDISINNMMVNEKTHDSPWTGFLIDLDYSIQEAQLLASGARDRTGTKAFMAIGVLRGEQHSFMHDLESFFWVLFWICIHYDGLGRGRVVDEFDKWKYVAMKPLAVIKLGTVADEEMFRQTMADYFTDYYKPLAPYVDKLRRAVFSDGTVNKARNEGLYSLMMEILDEASEKWTN
ncbi:hypothetical protein VM1G_09464 [Cytospora mali]|uniref:non-specific serine/threonine protein kinase n=1 Tax=Cytospora mali TaxID=578113 RepID=A0A194WC23_CYTMA|nr:hypothetical protein VM1G_09464 [Valsa mali]